MKEIIEQISRIDAIAFENEQKNKTILNKERTKFENEMKKYRDQKLEAANNKAKTTYNQIVSKAKSEHKTQEEKIKKIAGRIEYKYKKVEKDVIQEVFEKLFTV